MAINANVREFTCAYCDTVCVGPIHYSIHRDGFDLGPEVPLCDDCGGDELPSCEDIWQKTSEKLEL